MSRKKLQQKARKYSATVSDGFVAEPPLEQYGDGTYGQSTYGY